ncbi:MAG: hypothetical protein V7K40_22085 [Nostoc sp.]|uniref:hypothetical protein n=1 Tax=Nostoc sp. TaxID=1180 RepID=UPI002FF74E75
MPRLTVPPNFIGTSGIDTLAAEESNASVAIDIDILNGGVINTFSGNDSITGTGKPSTGGTKPNKPVTGIGINNSGTLNAGDGSDIITGIGTGLKFIRTGINNSSSLNTGNGIGISNSGSLKAGNGNDTITGTSTGVTPIGISNRVVLMQGTEMTLLLALVLVVLASVSLVHPMLLKTVKAILEPASATVAVLMQGMEMTLSLALVLAVLAFRAALREAMILKVVRAVLESASATVAVLMQGMEMTVSLALVLVVLVVKVPSLPTLIPSPPA